jgi:hypothetical protein
VTVGTVQRFNTAVDKVNDITYVNALGLVLWGYQMLQQRGSKRGFNVSGSLQHGRELMKKAKDWFKSLIS